MLSEFSKQSVSLPPEQEAIRAKCFHRSGRFEEFPLEEIEQSIPDRFEKIVRRYPERTAIKTKSRDVSYDALNRAANRLARVFLAGRGRGAEPVALSLKDQIHRVVANLAIFKAGKFALQTSPANSGFTIDRAMKESHVALFVTDSETLSSIEDRLRTDGRLINMDEQDPTLSEENLELAIPSDACAYIKYTSGSTKEARGTVKTHRYVLHTARNFTNTCRVCADDRIALIGRSSMFNDLLTGATLCPVDIYDQGSFHLADWLIQQEITIYRSFPTAFRHFASTLSDGEHFRKLRLIRLGSEPLYKRDVELYKRYFSPECFLVNSYGSTETGAICHYFIDKNSEITGNRVPVGYPLDGVEILVLDDLGKKVEINQTGEIVVKSSCLSSGYWQDDDLTREKFLSAPDQGEEQLYRTGDLGQMSEDGCLQYVGRKDSMAKIRGSRADIGGVEAVLANHPAVNQAAVITEQTPSGDTILVAYFVPKSKPAPTVTGLRNFLTGKLPDHMIPPIFVRLDELPISATGKIDRRALPHPDDSRPELDTPYVTPRTSTEQGLASIWAEVLSVNRVGVHDNFFDLGGHSLAATRIVSQVIKKFQLEIPLQSLFQSPTVAAMAAIITQHRGKKLGEKEMEITLTELESLSDEEAQRLLAEANKEDNAEDRHE